MLTLLPRAGSSSGSRIVVRVPWLEIAGSCSATDGPYGGFFHTCGRFVSAGSCFTITRHLCLVCAELCLDRDYMLEVESGMFTSMSTILIILILLILFGGGGGYYYGGPQVGGGIGGLLVIVLIVWLVVGNRRA